MLKTLDIQSASKTSKKLASQSATESKVGGLSNGSPHHLIREVQFSELPILLSLHFLNIVLSGRALANSIMPDWQTTGAKKREERDALIPKEWRLPAETLGIYNKDANLNVLDIPRSCGLLSAKEIELTEKYDATALLALLASGEIT
jgi:hypothetical protein